MRKQRTQTGQNMVILIFVMAFLILGVVGMFAFEISRANLAREQLRSACQSAALAGAATLASSDVADPTTAQNNAMSAALLIMKKNFVVGCPLTGTSQTMSVSGLSANNTPGTCLVYFELLDPNNKDAVVKVGDPNGKVMRVSSSFGLKPAFASYLGLSTLPIEGIASAGVPQLDIVLCFDVSGSIDDQTPVTFVKRAWNGTTGKIAYTVAATQSGSTAGALAQGTIYNILGPPATGTGLNADYPQALSAAGSGASWPLSFSESGTATGLRGKTNAGSPPGNYPGLGAGTGNTHTFTDLVVNIDGKTQFGNITADGYSFPDLATLVEAARGNLENLTVFNNSKANTAVTVIPKAGYQQEYFKLALTNTHPIYDAQQAAALFYTILNHDTDAHFGIVAFSANAGTSATDATSDYNVDSSYSTAGSGSCPRPNISLVSTTGTTNYSSILSVLPNTRANGNTNIGDAVVKALAQFKTGSRVGARKAIVVFTDGQPTSGSPLDSDPWSNARKAAVQAQTAGIPIYTIGLAQNPQIMVGEKQILNDTDSSSSTGGIAAIAGNGGRFFLVTNQQNLRLCFENLARQLVLLVRGQTS
jgi:hypothetical protein